MTKIHEYGIIHDEESYMEYAMELTAKNIEAINSVLAKDQRCEVIPTKDGVRIIRIKREEVKIK